MTREYDNEILRHCVRALIRIAGPIRSKFTEEICIGTYQDPSGADKYKYSCIFTVKTIKKKWLALFSKKEVEKKMLLKVRVDGREIKCFVDDESLIKLAKIEFERLIGSENLFKEFSLVFNKIPTR